MVTFRTMDSSAAFAAKPSGGNPNNRYADADPEARGPRSPLFQNSPPNLSDSLETASSIFQMGENGDNELISQIAGQDIRQNIGIGNNSAIGTGNIFQRALEGNNIGKGHSLFQSTSLGDNQGIGEGPGNRVLQFARKGNNSAEGETVFQSTQEGDNGAIAGESLFQSTGAGRNVGKGKSLFQQNGTGDNFAKSGTENGVQVTETGDNSAIGAGIGSVIFQLATKGNNMVKNAQFITQRIDSADQYGKNNAFGTEGNDTFDQFGFVSRAIGGEGDDIFNIGESKYGDVNGEAGNDTLNLIGSKDDWTIVNKKDEHGTPYQEFTRKRSGQEDQVVKVFNIENINYNEG